MMQYEAKMDVMDTSDNSWFEFFIDPKKASTILADPAMKKILPRLCIQFTEKGFMAEKEKDKTKLGVEELNLFERKAASMRLCAMAAFAALDWDIDYIIDNISRYELLTLRVLADHTYKIYNEKNLDATFGNWLFYRFVLSIDRRNRLQPPAPKPTMPTIYNQMATGDLALFRHDKVQRMITELREHFPKARAFITELAETSKDVIAPGIDCFLQPFAKLAPKALHTALIGDRDVLVEIPNCDFDIQKIVLPAKDVANKCRSELVSLCFTSGELEEAKKILGSVVKPTFTHPMINIDEKTFHAYSMILNVKSAFTTGGGSSTNTIKSMVFDQKILGDDNSIYRKSELLRERGVQETSGQMQKVYQAENAAKSLIDGHPECVREKVSSKAVIERFVKVLRRHLENIPLNPERKRSINGYLQFLCATIVDLRPTLARCGHDISKLREIAKPSPSSSVQPLPTSLMIDAIIQCDDAFWKILTKFNLAGLREAMNQIGAFWFPNTMPHSEFLNDIVVGSANLPNHTLQRLLLAKLEQLSKMKNFEAFRTRLQEYFTEMGDSNQWVLLTFESIHVHAAIGNHQCILPYERKLSSGVNAEQTSLIFKPDFRPTENSAKMINQCMALLLNLGEFKTVLEKGGHISIDQFPCVPIARLLGAYAQNIGDANMTRKCADGFSQTNTPKFMAAQLQSKRRTNDGVLVVDAKTTQARRDIAHTLHLFDLIRQPQLVAFILAYIVSLHNRVAISQKKLHLKMHAKLLPLFGNESATIDIQNTEDVRQCLRMMCTKAYAISRTDPDTIRTYADFLFVEGDYQAAGEKYMEFFAANSSNLKLSAMDPEVFHDTLLHRLRLCLAHSGYLTMSFLVCQFMKGSRQVEYLKSMALLRNNLTRDVGANCSEFVMDVNATEMLSTLYHAGKVNRSLETLYNGASSLSANKNIPSVLIQQEVNRRTFKFLTTLASIFFGMHT